MRLWLVLGILVLLLIVLLLILVMASSITVRMNLVLRSREHHAMVHIRLLYGLIDRRYEFPLRLAETGIEREEESTGFSSEGNLEIEDKTGEKMKDRLKLGFKDFKLLVRATDGLKDWLIDTMSKVKLSGILWSSDVALDNAAETAVAAGALWGVKHTVLGWLSYHLKMKSVPELYVNPDFNGPPQFSTSFHCTAKVSVAKMMMAGLGLLIRVLKVKGGIRIWRNTLSRELS